MNAIDTNVLVYAFDDQQPAKQAIAVALIDRLTQTPADTRLLWQVAGEFVGCLRRWQSQGRVSQADVEAYALEVLSYFPVSLPATTVISEALRLSARYSLSHWDSMLVAAAIEAGVTTLYTEDLQAGATYKSVAIVNPFGPA
jgi:predicted nucleic acid-binding protein